MTFLGVDLGTSGLRAVVMNAQGEVMGSAQCSYGTSNPHSGWSEQDPALWKVALDQAMGTLRESVEGYEQIQAIAVSGHMHGAVLLDEAGDVLRPCILWNDTRAHHEAAALDAIPQMRDLSGNIVFAGFTAPKLNWVQRHEPQIYAQVAKVLLPAAYMNFHLSAQYVGDLSDASGTSWCDVAQRQWSTELLELGHMRPDQMPHLVEGASIAGTLRPELAARWGLSASVTVAGGAGDNAAAACGIGAIDEGAGFVSLGTSGVVLIARDAYQALPDAAVHTFCHAVPERWYQMGVMLSATNSLNWLGTITGQSPSDLTAALGTQLRPPSDIQFFPYLSGERTPHNDPALRAGFSALSIEHDQRDLTQAVVEGVSFGLKDCLNALRQTGAAPEALYIIGGGAQSRYWVELLATVLNLPLHLPKGAEFGAALGAARLAQAAHLGGHLGHMSMPDVAEVIMPYLALVDRFEAAYERFVDAVQHRKT